MNRLLWACALAVALLHRAPAQVIEFEQNGLKYQTLTRSGITVMFAIMPSHLHEYAIVQVAVSNGAQGPYIIRPEDFTYLRGETVPVRAAAARDVILMLETRGTGSDAIKL